MKHRQEPTVLGDDQSGSGDGLVRIGVVTFPGTNDAAATARAVALAGGHPVPLWHADGDLRDVSALVLPGGSAHGDYLRPGALAARSLVMKELVAAAEAGVPVLGVGNGFQVLCEAGLLPGALARNADLAFACRDQHLRLEATGSRWLQGYQPGQDVVWPLRCEHGRYVADERELDELETHDRVVLRYCGAEPTGSARGIAGVMNAQANVVGVMAHPENAVEAGFGPDGASTLRSGTDGMALFAGMVGALAAG